MESEEALYSLVAGRAERDDIAGGRLVLAVGLPEDEDGCREGHLLRSAPGLGLGSPGVLENLLQADNLFAQSPFDFRRLVRFRTHPRVELLLEVGVAKVGGKLRRLGIATIADRVVQASLKLVLEPIFETDFLPCSYGFRPSRRAHDAVAEVRFFTSKSYEWIVEGDIKACFDEISHSALMDRVRKRVADKRVLALVKAFLKSGILGEDRVLRETTAGTPQGSILSPLMSNVALSVLDEFIAQSPGGPGSTPWARTKRHRQGLPNYRLSRYADDWCLMVKGTKDDAEALREEIAEVLSTMGLRLSVEKTLITHIDEGLDFLGWHIQRHRKRGSSRRYVYTYPSRKALKAAMGRVKTIRRGTATGLPLDELLIQINKMLFGWCMYFRPGVSSATFQYLSSYTWSQVMKWLRRKHHRINRRDLRRRYCGGGWWPSGEERTLFDPGKVRTTRYRYRGTAIPSPWPTAG
ncbi:reverse transcriptase domain-containing protein [Streptomyces sp. NPDC054765]